jgi:uncharacterized protein involved in oxidation of intracellular sulfur
MVFLLILNDPPYGTERSYNGLRLANSLVKRGEPVQCTVFLMGDAVSCAKAGQKTPDGYYNLERILKGFLTRGGRVLLCGTCLDARGLQDQELLEGCRRSSLEELTDASLAADKILVF